MFSFRVLQFVRKKQSFFRKVYEIRLKRINMKDRSSMMFSPAMNTYPIKPFSAEKFDNSYFRDVVLNKKNVNTMVSPRKEGQTMGLNNGSSKKNSQNEKSKISTSKISIPARSTHGNREICSRSVPNFQVSPLSFKEATESIKQPRTPENKRSPYAGAKFGDAPAPRVLPLPPLHWIPPSQLLNNQPYNISATQHLKSMLQIKA